MLQLPLMLAAAIGALSPDGLDDAAACRTALASLTSRVEENYAGYPIEIARSAERSQDYRTHLGALHAASYGIAVEDCHFLLKAYVDWFDDPHLFVTERPRFTEAEIAEYRAAARRIDPETVRTRLQRADLRPIEGLWSSPDHGEVAIVADAPSNTYLAVRMEPREEWLPGDVVARFVHHRGAYRATILAEDHTPRRHDAVIQKNVLLHMPPITWGRVSPLSPLEGLLIDPEQPRNPTFVELSDRAALLSIPSFSPQFRGALESLIEAHDGDIRARDVLIIDLRGNEGGSSGLRRLIEPYYVPIPPGRGGGAATPVVMSSRAIMSCLEGQLENLPESDYRTMLETLVAALEARPGALVPMPSSGESAEPTPEQTAPALPRPRHVAFLVDRHSVSAAEAVLLRARRSPKVTLFGENSAGSIDYQSVCLTSFGEGRLRHLLGFPSIAASSSLPAGGFNRTGVPVDVPIDLTAADPIQAVLDHYDRLR